MLSRLLRLVIIFCFIFALIVPTSFGAASVAKERRTEQQKKRAQIRRESPRRMASVPTRSQSALAEDVRRRLVTLPYYDVFDWLEGEVRPDGTAILRGQVVRPTVKTDAEASVREIEGIKGVVNEIEVLPLSPNDDRLRVALYRAIYNPDQALSRYAMRAVPPIHIIVKNGRATLKGIVATEMESQLAYTAARGVPGVFKVANELRVEATKAK